MATRNHNFRFNLDHDEERRAWEILHSECVNQDFKSQNRFVVKAINDYYERHLMEKADPYLSSREKEEAFIERIIEAVNSRLFENLPQLIGQYILVSGLSGFTVRASQTNSNTMQESVSVKTDVPEENDLLDFDAF
jgi:hypothetical protein